ncbi:hypothetical protein GCM10007862_07110 [Dyella lipolytica]|uniref:Uncharacterized protein n=1 Tax=Dyella lipolytica TaxID=1867835 RepID=A0ABW8IYL3_9GAMM|nr:hypothetical protein [Dyella lipolytica]GLQ45660.1 hypothetical protein GCM10007862_07110 [Dyella lipolytica]
MEEGVRTIKFRKELAEKIPRFPNNKESLEELMECSLATLFVHYLSWAARFVRPQKRKSVVSKEVLADPRWLRLRAEIEGLLQKSERGEPLHPHLSEKVIKRGFAAKAARDSSPASRWEDKDQILNTMGFHHFHLSSDVRDNGMTGRTKDILFAEIDNETFTAVAIVDHSVFESDLQDGRLTAEREKLWNISIRRKTEGLPEGTGIFPYLISSSGHNALIVMSAMHFSRVIEELDPKLEDNAFIDQLYAGANRERPRSPRLRWSMNHIDLGIADSKDLFFTVAFGKS